MTKDEIIAKELNRYMLEPKHIYHGTNAIPAAIHKAMDEYAKQQAIAFGFHVLGADPNDPEMGGIEEMSKTYNQFIEQQNKDNGHTSNSSTTA